MIKHVFGEQIMSRTSVIESHALFMPDLQPLKLTGKPISCTAPDIVARIQHIVR